MKALVVYESMYGNTHLIAEAIGDGMRDRADVIVVPVGEATAAVLQDVDLVVAGGPTHAHGLSRPESRTAAVKAAEKPESTLEVDPDAEGPGLREWFTAIGDHAMKAAAFDTRFDLPAAITGRASKGIARSFRKHGFTVVAEPESFFVTKQTHLEPDEEARAREWGAGLVASMVPTSS